MLANILQNKKKMNCQQYGVCMQTPYYMGEFPKLVIAMSLPLFNMVKILNPKR